MRAAAILLLGSIAGTTSLAAQNSDPAKTALVIEVLQVTQVAEQAITVMERSLDAQRNVNPEIPAVFWDRFIAKARENRGQLLELLVPVYAQLFTTEDLQGLLAFYKSPLGKRLLLAQPQLTEAAMEAGEGWGAQLGKEVVDELEAEGIKLN
jgi:hypothetical protein